MASINFAPYVNNYEPATQDILSKITEIQPGGASDPQRTLANIKTCARVFAEITLKEERPLDDREIKQRLERNATHYRNDHYDYSSSSRSFTDDPFLWYWLGRSSRGSYHCHRPAYVPAHSVPSSSGCGGCMPSSGSSECKGETVVALAVALVVLSDLIALIMGVYFTADAAKDASTANSVANEHSVIKEDLDVLNREIPICEGDETKTQVSKIGVHLTNISNRNALDKRNEAVYTGIFSLTGIALTHAIVSMIAVAIIQSSAAALATSAGLNAIAVLSVCYSAPVFVAIGLIATIGLLIYMANTQAKKQHIHDNQQDALDGLMCIRSLSLAAQVPRMPIPSAPPQEGEAD